MVQTQIKNVSEICTSEFVKFNLHVVCKRGVKRPTAYLFFANDNESKESIQSS